MLLISNRIENHWFRSGCWARVGLKSSEVFDLLAKKREEMGTIHTTFSRDERPTLEVLNRLHMISIDHMTDDDELRDYFLDEYDSLLVVNYRLITSEPRIKFYFTLWTAL